MRKFKVKNFRVAKSRVILHFYRIGTRKVPSLNNCLQSVEKSDEQKTSSIQKKRAGNSNSSSENAVDANFELVLFIRTKKWSFCYIFSQARGSAIKVPAAHHHFPWSSFLASLARSEDLEKF